MSDTITWQRVEGALVFAVALALALTQGSGLPLWAGLLVFFAPDISFVAYAFGPRAGAAAYNFVHLYGVGAAIFALGLFTADPILATIGALLLAHAGFDRALGYGLKSTEGFGETHLGKIGKP